MSVEEGVVELSNVKEVVAVQNYFSGNGKMPEDFIEPK
jgi:hypothetical protein